MIWLIGLAGAGKTSIARALVKQLREFDRAAVLLDGDDVREIMGGDLGHTLEDRRRNGWRICRLCHYLDRQGLDVVCATLSQFHDQQRWNRENCSRYFEVYIEVPLEVLIQRDQKGLYSGALAGRVKNVVGMDMPFAPPAAPDLILTNDSPLDDFESLAQRVLAKLHERFPDRETHA